MRRSVHERQSVRPPSGIREPGGIGQCLGRTGPLPLGQRERDRRCRHRSSGRSPGGDLAHGPAASCPLGDLAASPVDGTGAAISLNQTAAQTATALNCPRTGPRPALGSRLYNPGLDVTEIDDVYWGAANQAGEDNRNVARMAVLLAGLPPEIPAPP